MYNVCRINEKYTTVKNLLLSAFQTVDKVPPNDGNYKIERFLKGVWGLPPPASVQLYMKFEG